MLKCNHVNHVNHVTQSRVVSCRGNVCRIVIVVLLVVCLLCDEKNVDVCETVASWQHRIEYNTASAGLSKLGATPAAQVSG